MSTDHSTYSYPGNGPDRDVLTFVRASRTVASDFDTHPSDYSQPTERAIKDIVLFTPSAELVGDVEASVYGRVKPQLRPESVQVVWVNREVTAVTINGPRVLKAGGTSDKSTQRAIYKPAGNFRYSDERVLADLPEALKVAINGYAFSAGLNGVSA
ncbi:hypothetical protein SEA_BIGGITYBASS_52 [Gordonia phage BiggityBass]|nr:hypothetical protein SEA_BIGGITYBASS_52 [Gordonia phage BiggityBass]